MVNNPLQDSLTFHRAHDGQTPSVPIELPVDPLCDDDSCRHLSEQLDKTNSLWERHIATSGIVNSLPKEPGLYMFVWRPMLSFHLASSRYPHDEALPGSSIPGFERPFQVIYIGKAGDKSGGTIRSRFKSEYVKIIAADPSRLWDRDASLRSERLQKWLNLWPLEFWYLQLTGDHPIADLERQLIRAFAPPCNNQYKPRLKRLQPAFKEP